MTDFIQSALLDHQTKKVMEQMMSQVAAGSAVLLKTRRFSRQELMVIGAPNGGAVTAISIANPGTGYAVNNRVAISQDAQLGAVFRVSAVGAGGAITAVQLMAAGAGYTLANNVPTSSLTGNSNEDATVNILSVSSANGGGVELLPAPGQEKALFGILFGGMVDHPDGLAISASVKLTYGMGGVDATLGSLGNSLWSAGGLGLGTMLGFSQVLDVAESSLVVNKPLFLVFGGQGQILDISQPTTLSVFLQYTMIDFAAI